MAVHSDFGACFLIAVLVVLFYGQPDLWDRFSAYLEAQTKCEGVN